MMFRCLCLLLFVVPAAAAFGQDAPTFHSMYAMAGGGLSIRQSQSVGAPVLGKIPYGAQVLATYGDSSVRVGGMRTTWCKVQYNGTTGYVVEAYLLPVAPPAAGTRDLKAYAAQMGKPKAGPITWQSGKEINATSTRKTIYQNKAELQEEQAWEYYAEMLTLPDMSVEQAFLLLQRIELAARLLPADKILPAQSGEQKMQHYERSWRVYYQPDYNGQPVPNRVTFEMNEGAIETLDIVQIETSVVILFSSGV